VVDIYTTVKNVGILKLFLLHTHNIKNLVNVEKCVLDMLKANRNK